MDESKVKAAHVMIAALCDGERRWTMSVPARRDYDPDLVIADGLNELEQALRDTIHADTKARGESRRVMDAQTAEIERLREQVRVLQDERLSMYAAIVAECSMEQVSAITQHVLSNRARVALAATEPRP